MIGRYDAFAREERLARFAEFYLNFLTPPEVRFGGLRKLVAIGDGSTEGTAMYGQLATGFAGSQPGPSARLMGAWRAGGSVHGNFQGTSYLKIDEDLPAADPARQRYVPGVVLRLAPRLEHARGNRRVAHGRRGLPRPSPLRQRQRGDLRAGGSAEP